MQRLTRSHPSSQSQTKLFGTLPGSTTHFVARFYVTGTRSPMTVVMVSSTLTYTHQSHCPVPPLPYEYDNRTAVDHLAVDTTVLLLTDRGALFKHTCLPPSVDCICGHRFSPLSQKLLCVLFSVTALDDRTWKQWHFLAPVSHREDGTGTGTGG